MPIRKLLACVNTRTVAVFELKFDPPDAGVNSSASTLLILVTNTITPVVASSKGVPREDLWLDREPGIEPGTLELEAHRSNH